QAAGCVEALIERAEDHREHGAEGSMESANRIRERIRLLLDGSGNPWMCELQQQRAARAQEYRSLPVHPPGHRSRTEYAREWTGRRTAYQSQLALECFRAYDFERITLCCQHHDLTASAPSSARARDVRTQIWRMELFCQRSSGRPPAAAACASSLTSWRSRGSQGNSATRFRSEISSLRRRVFVF